MNPVQRLENIGGIRVPEGSSRTTMGTPLVSYSYIDGSSAIAILGADGSCLLSHTRAVINRSDLPQRLYQKMKDGGLTDEELSVIVAGTDPYQVGALSRYYENSPYICVTTKIFGSSKEDLDIGLNPQENTLLLYIPSSKDFQTISF